MIITVRGMRIAVSHGWVRWRNIYPREKGPTPLTPPNPQWGGGLSLGLLVTQSLGEHGAPGACRPVQRDPFLFARGGDDRQPVAVQRQDAGHAPDPPGAVHVRMFVPA